MMGLSIGHFVVLVIVIALFLYPWSKIFQKAGYSGWLCLLFLVPLVNLATLWWFALARWPLEGGAKAS